MAVNVLCERPLAWITEPARVKCKNIPIFCSFRWLCAQLYYECILQATLIFVEIKLTRFRHLRRSFAKIIRHFLSWESIWMEFVIWLFIATPFTVYELGHANHRAFVVKVPGPICIWECPALLFSILPPDSKERKQKIARIGKMYLLYLHGNESRFLPIPMFQDTSNISAR